MTVDDIRRELEEIEACSGDDESAHSKEDGLWESVLCAIADGADDPRALAREALRSLDIKFDRWCA